LEESRLPSLPAAPAKPAALDSDYAPPLASDARQPASTLSRLPSLPALPAKPAAQKKRPKQLVLRLDPSIAPWLPLRGFRRWVAGVGATVKIL
jgi:hypothetical protein